MRLVDAESRRVEGALRMEPSLYLNFDLLFTRAGDQYRAYVVDAPGGEADAVFDLKFIGETAQLENRPEAIRRSGSQSTAFAAEPAALETLGRQLYQAVFQTDVNAVWARSQEVTARDGMGLRIRLRFADDVAELALLPWETIFNPTHEQFMGLSESSPILRYLSLPRAKPTLLVEPPLRVLTLLANPQDTPPLNIEWEWRAIQMALADLQQAGQVALERLERCTLQALQARLLDNDIHILHFVGHGAYDASTQRGVLLLEDEMGNADWVEGQELAALLQNHRSLRIVYLSACQGALASTSNVFTGVAQTLVRNGLPAAVAMQAEITDQAAIDLASTFYQALANGYAVDAALTQARVTLASKRSTEWAIPVLFSRSPDNRLFDLRTVLPSPDCPYPGMAPFIESQAEAFFGRNQEIADAVERLRQHPFLSIVGPSGSGKSSLAYAGIIPALRQTKRFGAGQWLLKNMRPGANPFTRLLTTLDTSPERIADLAFAERTLLLIDQFEELFTQADEDEGQHFIAVLQTLVARPNLYILLTVRADFYPELMALPQWDLIKANRLELTPLGDEELRAAILEPAAQVGVTVDEALVERLVADAAGEAGVLPLLQETLVLLWEQVEQRHLGLAAYAVLGEGKRSGLQVAINRRANITYNNLPAEAQTIARRIFLRLVQFGEGRADTRRQLAEAALHAAGDDAKLFDQTLQHLADSRLLTLSGEEQDEARRVDIAHEALITNWEQLQSWIEGRREAEQIRRRLEAAAERFAALAHQGGFLDAVELHEAEQWLQNAESSELGVSDSLQLLIRQSHAKQRRNAVIRYASIALIVLLAVVAAGIYLSKQNQVIDERRKVATVQAKALATIDVQATGQAMAAATIEVQATAEAEQRRLAVQQSNFALARQLSSQTLSSLELKPDIELRLLLAVEAAKSAHAAGKQIQQVDDALRRALMQAPLAILHHKAAVADVIFSPDGSRLATQSRDHIVRLWDSATGKELAHYQHSDLVYSIYFSPDGSRLTTRSEDHTAYLVDSASGKELVRFQCENNKLNVVFSLDGSRLAFTCNAHTVHLWDSVNGKELAALQHQGTVSQIVFSPDSSRLATGRYDDTVRLWDSVTGKGLAVLQHEDAVNQVVFSPNGNQLATASKDDTVRLWESATGKELVVFRHEDDVDRVLFSSDGLRLASASRDHAVWLWDSTSGEKLARLQHDGYVRVFDFSPDGSRLATGSEDDKAFLVDATNGKELIRLQHEDDVLRIVFSPDSSRLVTLSGLWKGNIRLWDSVSGKQLAHIPLEDNVAAVIFNADGSRFAITTTYDGMARLVDADSGKERALLYNRGVTDIMFSPDGLRLATASEDTSVRIWDSTTGQELSRLQHLADVNRVVFSPDGSRLASASNDSSVRLWNSEGSQEPVLLRHLGGVNRVVFSPDGTRLASQISDGSIQLWDIANGEKLAYLDPQDNVKDIMFSQDGSLLITTNQSNSNRLWDSASGNELIVRQSKNDIFSAAVSLDGSHVATLGRDNMVRLWDRVSEDLLVELQHNGAVLDFDFSPDGSRLATGGEDNTAYLVDSASGKMVASLPHEDNVLDIAFNPDGSRLATLSADNSIWLWDSTNGQRLAHLPHEDNRWGVLFSPDGSRLANLIQGKGIWLWDSTNGEVVGHFQLSHVVAVPGIVINHDGSRLAIIFTDKSAHLFDSSSGREFDLQYKDSVSQVIFTPDGSRLATVSEDTSVRLWDSAAGQLLFKLPQGSVRSIVFSPDGSRLVTVNADHGVQLWDSNTGQILARLPHNADVGGIVFSPDGSHLTTMSGSTVRLWRPNISDLALLACRILTRDLTQAEWSEHFGSTELYHPTCAELPWPG